MSLFSRAKRAYFILFLDDYSPDFIVPKLARIPVKAYKFIKRLPNLLSAMRTRYLLEREWVHARPGYLDVSYLKKWNEPSPLRNDSQCLYYDINKGLEKYPGTRGAAFIFFCGIGDYLYATPAIEALRKRYDKLLFYGFVSKNKDSNNAPQVYDLIKNNPNFDECFLYDGRACPSCWKNYDYQDAHKDIPEDFLIIPMTYKCADDSGHRVAEVYRTFSLAPPRIVNRPLLYPPENPNPHVLEWVESIAESSRNRRGVCFVQFEHRSSGYEYPYSHELHSLLADSGYMVLTTRQNCGDGEMCRSIDFKKFTPVDSFELLRRLKPALEDRLFFMGCNSMSWALSGALNVPNLSVQHMYDENNFSLWFDNILVMTPHFYPKIPAARQCVDATNEIMLAMDRTGRRREFYNYRPETLVRQFSTMLGKAGN